MIDQQSASNMAFKTRFFIVSWLLITGLALWALDNFIDQSQARELHIFLEAKFASYSPIQLFGHKPLVAIDGQTYKAAGLAAAMFQRETVRKLINEFFIYLPLATLFLNSGIFYFLKKKSAEVEIQQHQLNKWEGN